MSNIFLIFAPLIVWGVGILGVIASVKNNFKKSPGHRAMQNQNNGRMQQNNGYMGRTRRPNRNVKQQPTVKMTGQRPQMQKGLFDMDLDRKPAKKEKNTGGFWRNSDYDTYEAKGRKKDFVSGYDKRLQKNTVSQRRAQGMQYSHTYDGHEPWDKCLPKEKDPWDKDFYA